LKESFMRQSRFISSAAPVAATVLEQGTTFTIHDSIAVRL